MVQASTALKVVQIVFMLFFMGMCFFPGELMAGYKLDLSCPPASRRAPPCDEKKNIGFLWFVMSLMGVQMLSLCAMNSAMRRDETSKKAQSVACLMNAVTLLIFLVNDLTYVISADYPASFPKEGVYGNLVLFTGLAAMCFSGWQAAGSVMPNFGNMIPSGRFGMPLLAGCVNLLFFGLPLTFIRTQFIAMYPAAADQYNELTPDLKYFALWMFGNVGKFILCNVISSLCVVSTEDKGKEDTTFRMLRAHSVVYMFYCGAMSKDCIINQLNGAVDPMRVMTVVQSFAVSFWQLNTWTSAGFTLKKA